jgi:NFU1 iron-sulfur cluster scaffold homolog, mitochondrial
MFLRSRPLGGEFSNVLRRCGVLGGVRTVFIDTVSTPNPHSMKFLPGQEVLPEVAGTGIHFERTASKEIMRSPLAKSLFTVPGVKGVFLARDFITITKNADEVWSVMKPQLFSQILDFMSSGQPVIADSADDFVSDTTILDTDDDVVAAVKELLESRIRPAVQEDGGDIYYRGFDEITGIVSVELAGSCVGCPSSSATLRGGVENMLKHYVPEVKGILEINAESDEDNAEPHVLRHSPTTEP